MEEKTIINVAGDYVQTKHVDYEIGNVEQGGIGIQIINNAPAEQETISQSAEHKSVLSDADDAQVLDLLFRADDDDRERTEILLSALLKGKKVKTKIVEELYEHRRYFNLENLTLEDKTKVMNAWIEKLGYTEQLNGKKFTIKDW